MVMATETIGHAVVKYLMVPNVPNSEILTNVAQKSLVFRKDGSFEIIIQLPNT